MDRRLGVSFTLYTSGYHPSHLDLCCTSGYSPSHLGVINSNHPWAPALSGARNSERSHILSGLAASRRLVLRSINQVLVRRARTQMFDSVIGAGC